MQIPNIVKTIKDEKSKGIKRYPCKSNRASSLGYAVPELKGCLRRGVYERTNWEEKELFPVEAIIRMDEGNHQEKIVLKDLAEAGFEIIEQQTMYEWKKYNITGHLDGKLPVDNIAIPLEIKSMSPNIFKQINFFDDMKKYFWTRAYMIQITLYMLMQGIDKGIFILKDKSSGELKQINVDLDYELGEYAIKTAELINKHINDNTLPEKIKDIEICKNCPFKLTCMPDKSFGSELKIEDDPLFEDRVDKYIQLEKQKKEATKIYDIIKERAKASVKDKELNLIVGKYHFTGKIDSRGGLRFKIDAV